MGLLTGGRRGAADIALRTLTILGAVLFVSADAAAQTSTTLWGNVTFDWVRDKFTYEVDFEPKVLLSAARERLQLPGQACVVVRRERAMSVMPCLSS